MESNKATKPLVADALTASNLRNDLRAIQREAIEMIHHCDDDTRARLNKILRITREGIYR